MREEMTQNEAPVGDTGMAQGSLQDTDFKYVLLDSGNIYIGTRLNYTELLEQDLLPFKMKAIVTQYLLKESTPDTTLESELYYLEEGSFVYDVLRQLKVKVKVNVQREKTTLFGKKKLIYEEKVLSLKELTEMNLAKKKGSGLIIREMIISKLALMTFSV